MRSELIREGWSPIFPIEGAILFVPTETGNVLGMVINILILIERIGCGKEKKMVG